ncbi:MAG: TIGR01777 family protein [Chloroflexi bacterium]|nr:TIGR01777 family protein [Chloroflexota bacterium]|tara:strand:+ start:14665 stop:15585 length:921 start_codon:yes stop_codon:yes gene_type:complete
MQIAITGSSGTIGSALTAKFNESGYRIKKIKYGSSADDSVQWNPELNWIRDGLFEDVDSVVHLGGASLSQGRWSQSYRKSIVESRINGIRLLIDALSRTENRPKTLVTWSAVGYYGIRGEEKLTEESERGSGFLSDICVEHELIAEKALELGIRLVTIRSGVVVRSLLGAPLIGQLSYPTALTPFKLGLGGPLGNGKSFFPWISLDDLVKIYEQAVLNSDMSGAYNAVAPQEITNSDFTKALGRVLNRPAFFPVPSFLLYLMFGKEKAQQTALASQRVIPQRLVYEGFEFLHPEIDSALHAMLKNS